MNNKYRKQNNNQQLIIKQQTRGKNPSNTYTKRIRTQNECRIINLQRLTTTQPNTTKKHKTNVEQSNSAIQEENTWKYTNMNSTTPNLHATINLHKPNIPIWPIIN